MCIPKSGLRLRWGCSSVADDSRSGNVLKIPEFALVALVGISGSGKSSFARKHFRPSEVLSSDYFRGLVSDDENNQAATSDAFDTLYYVARKRLAGMRFTVIDATNVQPDDRKKILRLAKDFDVLPVAIVLNLPKGLCEERNAGRPDRQFGPHVLRNQASQLRRSLRGLRKEGFRYVYELDSPEAVDAATIERQRLWTNFKHETGPFDVIGDVHGCIDELRDLLGQLGYEVSGGGHDVSVRPPPGRKVIFVGDLVDRGPGSVPVLALVMKMVAEGDAFCVPGNHDVKLVRWLRGEKVKVAHGLETTIDELERESPEFRGQVENFLDGLVSHLVLDDGRLVVAHAGLRAEYQGRASGRVRSFALYGETTGETDEFGLPVRHEWAREYRGSALVAYGHTPVPKAEWLNNTINIDTGCVFGGALTALRYPERELLSIPARVTYQVPARPIEHRSERSGQHAVDDLLDASDVLGRRVISTELAGNVTVREENAAAALEVMSRFAIDPRWLVYLPPTMSPCATSTMPGYLEFPTDAFEYYRSEGLSSVVCELKHMGSRAVMAVCREPEVAKARFGAKRSGWGAAYTRTGRAFFSAEVESEVLERTASTLESAGVWESLATDWVLLDAEIMPWSFKAVELLRTQYAAVGASASSALRHTADALERAGARGVPVEELVSSVQRRSAAARAFVDAYRRYCWPYRAIEDLKIAPFHVLASEGAVHADKAHAWHLEVGERLAQADPTLFRATDSRPVDLRDADSERAAVDWWISMTAAGAEGMVVKPSTFLATGRRGFVQPAIKCRGAEYLRIIYGPDYQAPENLSRLRDRNLGRKRGLAHRETALGLEGLRRFVAKEPLRRVHECVFGVLALESEPVDPRL